MKQYIYLVWDKESDMLVGVYSSEEKAREKLLDFLINSCGYDEEEWQEFADDNGYETIVDFQNALLRSSVYDEDMRMAVEERILDE